MIIPVKLTAKSASRIGESFSWKGEIEEGSQLLNFLSDLADKNAFIKETVFDIAENRLQPYHLIIINNKLLTSKDIEQYTFYEPAEIEIFPFVSGG